MNTQLQSNNITLQFGAEDVAGFITVNRLWQTFRRTAVEPGQSSSPDFASFADECLLCATIATNKPTPTPNDNGESLSNTHLPAQGMHLQDQPSSPSMTPAATPSPGRTVGLIYLHAGPSNQPAGEANIGVITESSMQRRGYAREAVQLVLRWAFEELKFHRVQAAILDTPYKDKSLRLFIGCGFMHEGTKRRAVYQPEEEGMAGIWKDVTYVAMLDTEWTMKSRWMRDNRAQLPPVTSVWDEMFTRHAREREELVRWEEKHGEVKRTSSTETLRERSTNAAQEIAYLTDDTSSSVSSSSPPSPRPNVVVNWEDDTQIVDNPFLDGPHQRWEDVVETSLAVRRNRQRLGSSSRDPSLQGHMLALPSIPSTRLSEGNLQSPLTIPSSPGSPPVSPSPSPAPSSTWPDSEDEDNWLPIQDVTPTQAPIPFTTPHAAHPPIGPASPRTRPRSDTVSSTGSWSDAQSSVGDSSWDALSDASYRSPPRGM